jgi:hypothetical protein
MYLIKPNTAKTNSKAMPYTFLQKAGLPRMVKGLFDGRG